MPTTLLASVGVTISELKKSPRNALEAGRGRPVAILNHNTPTHYAVPAAVWEAVVEALDDAELNRICDERLAAERHLAEDADLDELAAPRQSGRNRAP